MNSIATNVSGILPSTSCFSDPFEDKLPLPKPSEQLAEFPEVP